MRGDFEWANEALSESLGEIWDADAWGHVLLYNGYYDPDLGHDLAVRAQDALDNYIFEYYGLEFDEYFDWDAYREWYDSQ